MSHVSHRLKGAFQGALAGGGDPATSPLYVFGPFLQLVVASGAGAACFGAPLWMVVGTVIVVSLMYRHVMQWVPDGSGGSGLCEEEFGSWAVKINASITVIEYTLTFLVSIAALVTFVADRAEGLGRLPRTGLAVLLTIGVGVIVNRGPRLAAKVFGPATAAVLLLLWILVGAVLFKRGFHLPSLEMVAFSGDKFHVTLAGYVRLLALMTGIEVFANLVAAYDGTPEVRAHKAFGSLTIIMVTTLVTMLIVGPAIYDLTDPHNEEVSVFTQVMDRLLPAPLAYAGTLVGIVVLLSAAAAAAQGLQNLALGLRHRQYIPARFGQRNRFDVADRPVFLQIGVVVACFVAFGTAEETYLALYAAGVFVLLGLTGWASVKRLIREARMGHGSVVSLVGTVVAAILTSAAAALIFAERFLDGAWAYALLVPGLYVLLDHYRSKLGAPRKLDERLGRLLAERKSFLPVSLPNWPDSVLVVVDGSLEAEPALVAGASAAAMFSCAAGVCCVSHNGSAQYLTSVDRAFQFKARAVSVTSLAEAMKFIAVSEPGLLVVARAMTELKALSRAVTAPLWIVSGELPASARYPSVRRIVAGLDGSPEAEILLPHLARLLELGATAELVLVPDGDISADNLRGYAERMMPALAQRGDITLRIGGSGPARTIVERAREFNADTVLVGSHGRGGFQRAKQVSLGSVPERLIEDLQCSLLVVPMTAAAAGAVEKLEDAAQ